LAWAGESADRLSIARTISALNLSPGAALFTSDANSAAELARLPKPAAAVTISHEPMGEAELRFPADARIEPTAIRFLTGEVALVEAKYQNAPLLLVMKLENGAWKIATIRVLRASESA
jgi:hypothetical protein